MVLLWISKVGNTGILYILLGRNLIKDAINLVHTHTEHNQHTFSHQKYFNKNSSASYLLTSSLEPHEDRSHAGLSIHHPHLLPQLSVLEHALLVQLYSLLQDS